MMHLNKMAIVITIIVIVAACLVLGGLYYITTAPSGSNNGSLDVPNTQSLTTSTNSTNASFTVSSTPITTTTTSTPASDSLQTQVIKPGSGVGAKTGDSLTVNYTGTLTNGTVFDSSLNPGRSPFTFTLGGNVIQGWNQGLLGAKVGEELKLTVPPSLGYGSQANGPIPANSTLVFDITVLKIN